MQARTVIAVCTSWMLCGNALAGSSATLTPLNGTIGPYFNNGTVHGFGYQFDPYAGSGLPIYNLYDNVPTVLGGGATAGTVGGAPGAFVFADWPEPAAQWGDDLHQISAGGPGPAVITNLWYAVHNSLATSTHIVKIYDMVPPSVVPTATAPIDKGALLASIVVGNVPVGTFSVSIPVPNVALPNSAVWIKFEEDGFGFPGTSWLTGGIPATGYSHPGLTYTVKYPDFYNQWAALPYIYAGGGSFAQTNISLGLGGYHVPAPAAISVLVLGGLLVLRRRGRVV